jgi:hypothetical protein
VQAIQKRSRYFPYKYIGMISKILFNKVGQRLFQWADMPKHGISDRKEAIQSEADYFFHALTKASTKTLDGLTILVIGDQRFCDTLNNRVLKESGSLQMRVVGLGLFSEVTDDYMIPLDCHWNEKGHAFVASRLSQWIQNNELRSGQH